jgi:hypothetical protein
LRDIEEQPREQYKSTIQRRCKSKIILLIKKHKNVLFQELISLQCREIMASDCLFVLWLR